MSQLASKVSRTDGTHMQPASQGLGIKQEVIDQMNMHSEQSLNDMCSSLHDSSHLFKPKEETKEEGCSYAQSS